MSKPNNIDKIFTEGLEGYQVHPSSDVKSKIFASPMVIKPQKRWYLSKGFLLAGLFIITSSIIAGIMLFSSANSKSDGLFIDKAQNLLSAINTKSALSQETLTNSDNINTTQLKQASVIKNQSTEILTNNSSNKENHSLQETNQDKIIKNKQIIQNTNSLNASLTKQEKQNINNNDSDKLLTQNNSTKLQIDESTISKTVSSNELNQNKQTNSSSVSMNIFTNTETNNNNSVTNSIIPEKDKMHISFISETISKNTNIETSIAFMNTHTSLLPTLPFSEIFNPKDEIKPYYQKGIWYLKASTAMFISNYKSSVADIEWKPVSDAKQNMLKPSISNEFGLNIIYQRNRWQFKGGISYANYGEKLSAAALLTNPHQETNISYNGGYYEALISGIYYDIDTTSYYHYTYGQTNHIYIVDSTLAWETHYRPVDVTDTNNITRFDTIPKTLFNNRISYVELPLGVGYSFPQGQFNFILTANIIPGYFSTVKGMQMNTENYPALEAYSTTIFKKFTLSAGVGLEIEYSINEIWTISLEPFYKKVLFNIYSNEYHLDQRIDNYGFRIGLKKLL